jgi:alginate O-acetyltransferase complex protein AlgI
VFLFSGIVHELGISVPTRAGYGLPTLYFVLQAAAVLCENAKPKRAGLARLIPRGRWATLAIVFVPIPMLFHPWFLERVIVPMMVAAGNWLGKF